MKNVRINLPNPPVRFPDNPKTQTAHYHYHYHYHFESLQPHKNPFEKNPLNPQF